MGDILLQHIVFSKIITEQYKNYGKTIKTIDGILSLLRLAVHTCYELRMRQYG